jgi:hypothetical protein
MPVPHTQIVDTNIVVEAIEANHVEGYTQARKPYIILDRGGRQHRLVAPAAESTAPVTLDGAWEFEAEMPNALVIGTWLATLTKPGAPESDYVRPGADTSGWQPQVAGAWSYQLLAEPDTPYPIDVWYRIGFEAEYLPLKLELIVDGFAGSSWKLFVNGESVTSKPTRSAIDSQMKAIDITPYAHCGENIIAIRITLTSATDGLLDLLKIVGDFSLAEQGDGYRITAPRRSMEPAAWTSQGYPFFSGRASYCRRFQFPREFSGQRVFVEPAMGDDALEVIVNGHSAGVRLWAPYAVEITDLLRPGENTLELRVANTLVNLIEATRRPSGLAGAPRLLAYRRVEFRMEE